ncbi:hypothetical protein TNCT_334601 [Trichonephila clavata]|uniref:Uncharacterized protein n=1 Tax=Trichonephila clavata TaxID=2740835 RepID=A0A8X6L5E4_TRICU|nr:hypothetical protein TNCT_334601 [Trichonephila clavata]
MVLGTVSPERNGHFPPTLFFLTGKNDNSLGAMIGNLISIFSWPFPRTLFLLLGDTFDTAISSKTDRQWKRFLQCCCGLQDSK